MTVTKLGCYRSEEVVKRETIDSHERVMCLVGDAFLGVPFFRSMNNGLKCGTKLAECVTKQLNHIDHPQINIIDKIFSLFGYTPDPMRSYTIYAKAIAWWEIIAANVKSCFISIYANWVSADFSVIRIVGRWVFSNLTPSEYLSEAEAT